MAEVGLSEAINRIVPAAVGSGADTAIQNTAFTGTSTSEIEIPRAASVGGRWVTFTPFDAACCVAFGATGMSAALVTDKQFAAGVETDWFVPGKYTHMRVIRAASTDGTLQWHVSSGAP